MATIVDVKGRQIKIAGSENPGTIPLDDVFLRVEKQPYDEYHVVGVRCGKTENAARHKVGRVINENDTPEARREIYRPGQSKPSGNIKVYYVPDET